MPFKPQFDESRAPVFTPEASVPRLSDTDRDLELARAMQYSINASGDNSAAAASRQRTVSFSQYSPDDMVAVAAGAVEILTSALDGATTVAEVKSNDILPEIVQQCEQLQRPLASLIERAIVDNPEVCGIAICLG